jgi:hypothetical protein
VLVEDPYWLHFLKRRWLGSTSATRAGVSSWFAGYPTDVPVLSIRWLVGAAVIVAVVAVVVLLIVSGGDGGGGGGPGY